MPLLDNFSNATLLFLVASAFVGGLARGFSGFGGALIFVPLASAVTSPTIAAPVLLMVDTIVSAGLVWRSWGRADKREAGIMSLGMLAGIPAGSWVLSRSDPMLVRWLVAAIVVALLALLVSGWRYRGQPRPAMTAGVGVVSGLLNGIALVGGPPIIAYWLGSPQPVQQVRANIVAVFVPAALIAIAAYAVNGLFSWTIVALSVLTGPAYGFGMWIGGRVFGFADEETFRRICYGLIAAAAVISLPFFDHVFR